MIEKQNDYLLLDPVVHIVCVIVELVQTESIF